MRLYHYTSHCHIEEIKYTGLAIGDVPVSKTRSRQAVWLTTDPTPERGHGLQTNLRTVNKRAIRIELEIPESDTKLTRWVTWARGKVSEGIKKHLNKSGGYAQASWWLYWGVLPAKDFVSVDVLEKPSQEELDMVARVISGELSRVRLPICCFRELRDTGTTRIPSQFNERDYVLTLTMPTEHVYRLSDGSMVLTDPISE
jgi:hypothetical protein